MKYKVYIHNYYNKDDVVEFITDKFDYRSRYTHKSLHIIDDSVNKIYYFDNVVVMQVTGYHAYNFYATDKNTGLLKDIWIVEEKYAN